MAPSRTDKARARRIEIIRQRLIRKSRPRILVAVILSLTAFAGFLTSFSLLHLGVTLMWLRYPIAISVAYCVFLLLLALWLWLQRRSLDLDPSLLDFIPTEQTQSGESLQFGGGRAGGGGAGGSWTEAASSSSAEVSSGDLASPPIGLDLDLEEGWLLVVAIIALVGGLIASFYLIYIAPVLLAELLVDGILVAGLYRRVKEVEQRHWIRAALRRTLLPAVVVALFFAVAGYTLQRAVPEAHTIGEIWHYVMRRVDR
jgi:hypothetical protein